MFPLLSSFQADDNQLLCVLNLIKLLNPEDIHSNAKAETEQLCSLLKKLFLVRENELVLANVAEVMVTLKIVFQEPISQIISDIVESLIQAVSNILNNPKVHLKPQGIRSMILLLQRVFALISKCELPEIIGYFENFADILELLVSVNSKDANLLSCASSICLQILYSILLWKLSENDVSNNEFIECMESQLALFFNSCEKFLLCEDLNFGVHAFRICGDFFLLSDSNDLGIKGLVPSSLWESFHRFFVRYTQSFSESFEESEILEVFLPASKAVLSAFDINQKLASEIISRMNMFGSSIDSLIRQLMSKLKSWDSYALLSVQLHALQIVMTFSF